MRSELRIRATFESQQGAQRAHEYTVEIRRSFRAADLLLELDRFWQTTRNLAAIKGWIATLAIDWPERSRSVSLHYPADDSSAQIDPSVAIFEALGSLIREPHDDRRSAARSALATLARLEKKSEAR